jgi:hypothetical protein
LKRQVKEYLLARAPAGISGIHVTGPVYWPVDVAARLVAANPRDVETVERRVREALLRFLHPQAGGPTGEGWPFGRDVYQSDVAAMLEGVAGVDYVEELQLAHAASPQGERVEVPGRYMVCAGAIAIHMRLPGEKRG